MRNTHKELNSSTNMFSSFCLSLFKILLNTSCATLSVVQGEDFQKSLTFTCSTKNKIHFSPLRKEPSLKQREDLSLSVLSLVVEILSCCNFLLIQEKFAIHF